MKKKAKTGFRQLSDHSYNIARGCENDCLYCWAREMAERYKTCTAKDWPAMQIDQAKVDKPVVYKRGVWAFPTTHDITENNINEYMFVLRKLLAAGNQVLITTKPRFECIQPICAAFLAHRDQIEFLFTIGSTDDEILRFWEPNAPGFGDRLDCLRRAFDCGYKVGVLCEPYLDGRVEETFARCREYISGKFWIGRMNQFERRVDLSKISQAQQAQFVDPLRTVMSDGFAMSLYQRLKDEPEVAWKDSFADIYSASKI